jgi:hypothetical protein
MDDYWQCLSVKREPKQTKSRAQLGTDTLHVEYGAALIDTQRGVAARVGADFIYEFQARMPDLVGHEVVEALGGPARIEGQARIMPLHEQIEHQVEALRNFVDIGQIDDVKPD